MRKVEVFAFLLEVGSTFYVFDSTRPIWTMRRKYDQFQAVVTYYMYYFKLIRILCRRYKQSQAVSTFYVDEARMTRYVKESAIPCNCDHCMPDLYQAHCHQKLMPTTETTGNRLGNLALATPVLEEGAVYEGMDLARQSIKSFQVPIENITDVQLEAIEGFKAVYRQYDQALNTDDASEEVPDEVLTQMVQYFNHIFFLSAFPKAVSCRWSLELGKGVLAKSGLIGTEEVIELHPITVSAWDTHAKIAKSVSRINSLLHECIHTYLERNLCRNECLTFGSSIGEDGHGRAFRILELELRLVSGKILSMPELKQDTKRTRNNLANYWRTEKTLPSLCDLRTHGFAVEDEDVPGSDYPQAILRKDGKVLHFDSEDAQPESWN